MNNLLNNLKKYYTKKNVDKVFFLLPILAFAFIFVKYSTNESFLNKLEALPAFYLVSNNTAAGQAAGTLFTAISGSGFSIGADTQVNTNSDSYVAWNWAEGTVPGVDVLTYTGTGAAHTIAHSLADTPDFIIVKRTNAGGDNWFIYHQSQGATIKCTFDAAACGASAIAWDNTAPTSANFTVGTSADTNTNGGSHIAYVFAEKAGFSKFNSYTGNGSTDGPFVYTGFKPRYLMIKNAGGGNWVIWDTARDTTNPASLQLFVNSSAAESSSTSLDINANGFKIRNSGGDYNTNGATYIYAAFAEYPFERATVNNGYTINNSGRFDGSTQYLSRTNGGQGDNNKFTVSFWYKRTSMGTSQWLWGAGSNTTSGEYYVLIEGGDTLLVADGNSPSGAYRSTQLFRDPSKWYHIVVAMDNTLATGGDRLKIYVDGVQITSWSLANTPTQNKDLIVNDTGQPVGVGRRSDYADSQYANGYIADVNYVDGQQLAPTSFGAFDGNGNWGPISYAGGYGVNGYHLDFANSADPGNDVSGNNNDFTNNGLAVTDNVIDSPTNNFSIFHQIFDTPSATLSKGGLYIITPVACCANGAASTFTMNSPGKWYAEFKLEALSGTYAELLLVPANMQVNNAINTNTNPYQRQGCQINGIPTTCYNPGDTIMAAFDASTGSFWLGVNGVWNQGNPATGVAPILTGLTYSGGYYYALDDAKSDQNTEWSMNFGQGGQAGLNYDAAAGGYFLYTPPTGFKAMSSANLISTGVSSIADPSDYFDVFTYTGNGTAQTFTSLQFEPILVWVKDRTSALNNVLFGDGVVAVVSSSIMQWFEF